MRRCIFLLLLLSLSLVAKTEGDPTGGRPTGMSNAALTFTDIWSIFQNQAGLAHLRSISAGAFYESRFLIPELAFSGFALGTPVGNGAIGLSFSNFGSRVYREGEFGLAYGMRLAPKFSMGVKLNYQSTYIAAENYGKNGVFTAEIGFRIGVSEKVTTAVHIDNPTRTQLNTFASERLPTVLRLGVGYQISQELLLAVETEKDIDHNPLFRGGIEYEPAENFYLRVGASNQPYIFCFGLGFRFKSFQFDLATSFHSLLGHSPHVSLTYNPLAK